MSISTSRTSGTAHVSIRHEICCMCRKCLSVCKGMPLYEEQGKIAVDQSRLFGCIACGHCVAICPTAAIRVEGRTLSMEDIIEIPSKEQQISYDTLYNMMLARRSIRNFKPRDIEKEMIDKIVRAAKCAPMGIPPSDVKLVILASEVAVADFSRDFLNEVKKIRWMFSPVFMLLYRLFIKKATYDMIVSFVRPVLQYFSEAGHEDDLQYKAPLAMGFFGGPASDVADADIAATYATLAAESLGLGSCFIGTIPAFLKYSGKKLKKKYQIPEYTYGAWIILGFPESKFLRAVKRSFADEIIIK